MHTILSEFLKAGLLQIGEDDEKLKLLESAAQELAKQIKAKPLLLHRFALVALDPQIPAADPVHKLTEVAVFEKWQTITNKIGSNPVQVYRAVILRAIEIAASEMPVLPLAIILIASCAPVIGPGGKEQVVITNFLKELADTSQKHLSEVWVNSVEITIPKLSSKSKKTQISKEELLAGMSRAVGPHDKDNKPGTAANPHWPNAGPPWSFEFVGRATDAIYTAIQSSTKGFTEDVQEVLNETVHTLANGFSSMAIRDAKSELLWIRASLYSPSAKNSYREMLPQDLMLHSALDISRVVNRSAPPSVEFFLRELVGSLNKKKYRLADTFLALAPALSQLAETRHVGTDGLALTGRRGLLDYAVRRNTSESVEEQTGYKDIHEENLPEMAARLYRELQILKLLTTS